MNILHVSPSHLQKTLAVALILPFLSAFIAPGTTYADSVSDLQKQQSLLEKQAQQALQQAQANQTIAERAAAAIVKVNSQIGQLQTNISSTQGDISSTQSQIDDMNQQVAQLESQMGTIQAQQNDMVRELYILRESMPSDVMALFANQTVSALPAEQEQYQTLEKYFSATYSQFEATKKQVENSRSDLELKNQNLTTLVSQQQDQKRTLADAQSTQQALQKNAVATETQLEAKAATAQAQAAQIAQKVKLLTTTTNWGSQIVSSDEASWYYSQTGDYTRLGNSSETINNVGCLITSIAMVATFYGYQTTPDDMANNASFSGEGSYYWGTPSSLGVKLQPSGSVNWGVVQQQLDNGHPVIVSIYLPSIGRVNSDGSSHYIVLKSYADGKYFMHDPIGHGRSYNLNQVRSMILTVPR